MGPPCAVDSFPHCILYLDPYVGVIGHDWREFGRLPVYEFGEWRCGLEATRRWRNSRLGEALPFDPIQYPLKPKGEKAAKLPKPKSNRLRYSNPPVCDNVRYWRRDQHE